MWIIQTIITFKHTFKAFDSKSKKLLNIFIAFLKGWIQYPNLNLRKDITNKLLGHPNQPWCFNLPFHAILINLNILDLNEYQYLVISYLENPTTRPYFIKFISDLKKYKINDLSNPSSIKLPKLYEFYYNEEKCNKYFLLFGKMCKLPSDLHIISESAINYKICNIKDQKTYQVFTRMCFMTVSKIVGTKFPFQRLEPIDLHKILGNFIQSPFITNDE